MKNFYPEKPVVPYKKSTVEMGTIVAALKGLNYSTEVKRAAYVVIRNETANGTAVINGTNLCGAQGDSGRWPSKWDQCIQYTCIKKENMTGKERVFLVFDTLANGIAFICDRVQAKGIFIGENVDGKYHKGDVRTPEQLADAYQDEWVHGEDHNTTPTEIANFSSMYDKAKILFP